MLLVVSSCVRDNVHAGCEAAVHAMGEILLTRIATEHEGILLVDASNAFNSLIVNQHVPPSCVPPWRPFLPILSYVLTGPLMTT